MNILLIGTGVIGTVYGAQLAVAGQNVCIYEHGDRTEQIKKFGLVVKDALTGVSLQQSVKVVDDPSAIAYDLVLVAIRADQLATVFPIVKQLSGKPTILFFGNNPNGRLAFPKELSNTVELGFPGIGGSMHEGTVEYVVISQQSTAIQSDASGSTREFAAILRARGFKVKSVDDMDGYLLYHAVFVASIAAALYRCATNPIKLSTDRSTLRLMCRSIEEGFRALRSKRLGGEPRNLRVLHMPLLRPFAMNYWSRTFQSPLGELEFSAHARSARGEMLELAQAALSATANSPTSCEYMKQLLNIELGNYTRNSHHLA